MKNTLSKAKVLNFKMEGKKAGFGNLSIKGFKGIELGCFFFFFFFFF